MNKNMNKKPEPKNKNGYLNLKKNEIEICEYIISINEWNVNIILL
jgi:hypothetical protein